jgi:hypothetical protein
MGVSNQREEKRRNQRVALIQLHTIKSLNYKNNEMAGITTYLSVLMVLTLPSKDIT